MYLQIRSVVEQDLLAVNRYILDQLHSSVPLIENIGHYIVEAGGKRIRPMLLLLAARSGGLQDGAHIPMAAVIEFIHTATLLHDDVVDTSTLRRGRPTVNAEWNNPSSVLVGDFIYSRAFQIMVQVGDMRIMEIMADTTNRIAEGEVLQLIARNNPDTSETSYMQVIENKTAVLFQAAAQCGAILAGADRDTEMALRDFGRHLGIAFQLIDDVLDYDGEEEATGKNVGDDLAEGRPTLPLIYAMQHGSSVQVQLIKHSLEADSVPPRALGDVIRTVRENGALDYTRALATQRAEQAVDCLAAVAPSRFRDAMQSMAEFSITRTS